MTGYLKRKSPKLFPSGDHWLIHWLQFCPSYVLNILMELVLLSRSVTLVLTSHKWCFTGPLNYKIDRKVIRTTDCLVGGIFFSCLVHHSDRNDRSPARTDREQVRDFELSQEYFGKIQTMRRRCKHFWVNRDDWPSEGAGSRNKHTLNGQKRLAKSTKCVLYWRKQLLNQALRWSFDHLFRWAFAYRPISRVGEQSRCISHHALHSSCTIHVKRFLESSADDRKRVQSTILPIIDTLNHPPMYLPCKQENSKQYGTYIC